MKHRNARYDHVTKTTFSYSLRSFVPFASPASLASRKYAVVLRCVRCFGCKLRNVTGIAVKTRASQYPEIYFSVTHPTKAETTRVNVLYCPEASISLHGWGHTQWPINPPTTVLLSCHVLLRTTYLLYGMKS